MKKLWCFTALVPLCLGLLLCGCGEGSDDKAAASVALDQTELSLTVGEEATLNVTATDCVSVVWSAKDGTVASVSGNETGATVKAESVGSTEITVTGKDANGTEVTDTCKVTVTEKALSINLPAGKLVLKKGRSASVKAFAKEGLTGDIVWETSDASVGTVEYQGLNAIVTAQKKGTCTITVKFGGEVCSFELVCGLT